VEEARRIFARGVQANCPDAASIYHGYARLELSLGNIEQARELLLEGQQKVQQQDVGKDYVHRERALFLTHTLGMLELNRNHPTDALAVFTEGIDRYGNSSQLLLGAALCELMLGRQERARTLFEQSVVNDDKHAQAWQAWGVMEMRAGNIEAAKTLFECGIKHAPRHGALWQAYATMESRLGNVENARALFQTGIKKAPCHVPLYQSWAQMELREGNEKAAKALIAQSLTRDKRNGSGWLIAAQIEERLGNDGLANLLLRRGIECSPTKAELYRSLGNSLMRKRKINEAREIFERGIEVDPTHAPLYHSLAELEAQIFNLEGLSRLNKKAAQVFSKNALEPPAASSEALATKIKAKRSPFVPRGVTALAQRIVEEEGVGESITADNVDPTLFLDKLSSSLLEDGLVGQLLTLDEDSLATTENQSDESQST
jgi:tetratricopeptide (TPR) repeat protein